MLLHLLNVQLDIFNDEIEGNIVYIDAPNLAQLHVGQVFTAKYMAADLSSLVEASATGLGLESDYYGISELSGPILYVVRAIELLTTFSGVKSLTLYRNFMHVLDFVYDGGLPIFHNLTCLNVFFEEDYGWKVLPYLLKISPNLENSVVDQRHGYRQLTNWGMSIRTAPPGNGFIWCEPYSVPSCLSLHLQMIEVSGFEGNKDELKMVEHLLGNAEVLKLFRIKAPGLPLVGRRVNVLQAIIEIPKGFKDMPY